MATINSDTAQRNADGKLGTERTPDSAPETIHISLPALRATILTLLDDGDRAMALWLDKTKQPWDFYDDDDDVANNARMRFCVQIERRLRQLPARG